MIVVANRPEGFSDDERRTVESVAEYLAPILQSHLSSEIKEIQLRQAQKMEALGALAGGIAHDFNNILQAILGFSTLAREEAPESGHLAGDLDRVLSATHRGQELVQRILLFSRREEQERQPVEAEKIVQEAVGLLQHSIPATIEIRVALEAPGARILADPTQISQVVLNLATNALHAMEPDGGVLEIGLRWSDRLRPPPAPAGRMRRPSELGRDHGARHRLRHDQRGDGAALRSLLHDQGGRQGDGSRDVGGARHRHRPQRRDPHQQRAGSRDDGPGPAAPARSPTEAHPAADVAATGSGGGRILFVDDEADIATLGKALLEKQGHR